MEIIFHYWLQIFRTLVVHCIPTLITVFIFFQPLKMNWPISLMLVCLMRETGKKKRVYKLISLVISDFNWNMPHLSAGKLCGVRWYQFTGYVGIISGPETITCKFFVSDVFGRMDLKQVHLYFFFYSLASICSFGSQKNQWVCNFF